MPRPIRAAISAGALQRNFRVARAHAGNAKIWAVLKANAYGHGLERVARALEAADGFAVLDFAEAARLRLAGVKKPILMLEGMFEAADVPLLHEYSLTPVIHNQEQIDMLRRATLPGRIDVYLKLNTGMNRLGFTMDGLGAAHDALHRHPAIGTLTLMTHFADADGAGGVTAQLERLDAMAAQIEGLASAPRSLANSAALMRYPQTCADWVRPGIMLYGCSPFADRTAENLGLAPAMTLTSALIGTQRVRGGERIGYGFSFEAQNEMTIGIVACGYADGYPRHAPSGTPVLVNGRRTRIVGRVAMDMLCVELSAIPEARIGAPVTLWGEGLPADEVAAWAGTLSYELLCAVAPRVPVAEIS